MRFWYSTNREQLQSLSVLIGQLKTDLLNQEMNENELVPMMRYGTIREYDGGYILDYSTEYSEYSDLSTLDIKLNELIN